MNRNYQREVEELKATYFTARNLGAKTIAHEFSSMAGSPATFIGSGGAFAVAQLASDLHLYDQNALATALTPVEFSAFRPTGVSVGIFSSRAKHGDTYAALKHAVTIQCRPIILVTQRERAALELPPGPISVVTLPAVWPDGFLATNSVLLMCTALVRLHLHNVMLPQHLPHVDGHHEYRPTRLRVIVLFGPRYRSVAADLEARFCETGLADIETVDYRNFAHGRHRALSARLSDTTIIALEGPEFKDLSEATLSELPAQADIIRLRTDARWPIGALDLLAASMRLLGATSAARDFEPAESDVADYGRRLYNLSVSWDSGDPPPSPVARKIAASGAPVGSGTLRRGYEKALEDWSDDFGRQIYRGIVLDYDGTCCETAQREDPPSGEIQKGLTRLLEAGVTVGFATGRGKSLQHTLRSWVPSRYLSQVRLALYNGGLRLRLDEDMPGRSPLRDTIAAAADRLDGERGLKGWFRVVIEPRSFQVSLRPSEGGINVVALARAVEETLRRPPSLPLKVVCSGHSVDVVPSESSKAGLLLALAEELGSSILAIGDQGQLGGNDFDLLAAAPYSLTVDRCSGDPSRCWNLDRNGLSGPRLLSEYLRRLDVNAGFFRCSGLVNLELRGSQT